MSAQDRLPATRIADESSRSKRQMTGQARRRRLLPMYGIGALLPSRSRWHAINARHVISLLIYFSPPTSEKIEIPLAYRPETSMPFPGQNVSRLLLQPFLVSFLTRHHFAGSTSRYAQSA